MLKRFIKEEDGIEVLEIAIITVVLLTIALAFRKQMIHMMQVIMDKLIGQ